MKALAHILCVAITLGLLCGLCAWRQVDLVALANGGVDAVSSATAIQAAPSGNYTILINRSKHPDEEALNEWKTFFEGGAIGLIFEDVSCVAFTVDPAGVDMATSLQSRLPENQMTLRTDDAVLALSKAEHGVFDIIVMSDEAAQTFDAAALYDDPNVVVVHR